MCGKTISLVDILIFSLQNCICFPRLSYDKFVKLEVKISTKLSI